MLKKLALALGVVLLIAWLSAHYLGEEILFVVNVVVQFAKVFWSKLLALSFREVALTLLPFGKRFLFVEVPKKVAPILLLVGVIPGTTRRKIKVRIRKFRARARYGIGRTNKLLRGFFGNKTALVISLFLSAIAFVIVYVFFGSYLVVFFGSTGFVRYLGIVGRYVWAGMIGRFLRMYVFRILAFLGFNQAWNFAFRRVSSDARDRVRRFKFRLLRKTVRRRRITRRRLTEMKEQRIQRIRFMISVWQSAREERKKRKEAAKTGALL